MEETETKVVITAKMMCLHVRSSVRPHPGTQPLDVSRECRPGGTASDSWVYQVTDTPGRLPRPGQPGEEKIRSLEDSGPRIKRASMGDEGFTGSSPVVISGEKGTHSFFAKILISSLTFSRSNFYNCR